MDCLQLCKARLAPEGWNKDAIDTLAHQKERTYGFALMDIRNTLRLSLQKLRVLQLRLYMDDNMLACWGDVNETGNDIVRHSEVPLISNWNIFFLLFCSSFGMQDSSMTPSWLMSRGEMMFC